MATLLVVLEEDGRNKGLQVHQVLVEVACVLVLPDASLQVVLARLAWRKDIDAWAVIWQMEEWMSKYEREKRNEMLL